MAFDGKYEFEELSYGVAGWNGILQTNMEKIEDNVHSILLGTLGETISAYDVLYVEYDGKYYQALSNKSKQPAIGIALESGDADDEIKIQRIGAITNAGWSLLAGRPVYLSDLVLGGIVQVPPLVGTQFLGMALTTTSILLNGTIETTALASTTTTTSTTTTSSTTTSSTTSTTSSTTSTSSTSSTSSTTSSTSSTTTTTTA